MTVIGAIVGSFAFTNWVILRMPYARHLLSDGRGSHFESLLTRKSAHAAAVSFPLKSYDVIRR